jgi:hypothetical protein
MINQRFSLTVKISSLLVWRRFGCPVERSANLFTTQSNRHQITCVILFLFPSSSSCSLSHAAYKHNSFCHVYNYMCGYITINLYIPFRKYWIGIYVLAKHGDAVLLAPPPPTPLRSLCIFFTSGSSFKVTWDTIGDSVCQRSAGARSPTLFFDRVTHRSLALSDSINSRNGNTCWLKEDINRILSKGKLI